MSIRFSSDEPSGSVAMGFANFVGVVTCIAWMPFWLVGIFAGFLIAAFMGGLQSASDTMEAAKKEQIKNAK